MRIPVLAIALLFSTTALAEPKVLTLRDAQDLAKRHAFASRIASFRTVRAKSEVGIARVEFLPDFSGQISAGAYEGRVNPDYFAGGASTTLRGDSYEADLSASYVLLSSTRRLDLSVAKLRLESQEAATETSKREVLRDTARAYLQVVGNDGFLTLAESDFARRSRHLDEARALAKAGKRAEFEVIAAEAQLADAEAKLVEAKNNVRISRAVLAQTVGTELPLDFISEAPARAQDPRQKREMKDVIGDSLKRRGEIRGTESDATAARLAWARANRQYLPTVSLYANYNRVLDVSARDAFIETVSYGGQLQVRFSDMMANKHRARAQRADYRIADVIADQTRVQISLEVERAALEVDRATEVMAATQKSLDASRRNYEQVTERYRLGVATQTERIDAESSLVEAEYNAGNAQYRLDTALWNLRYEMGESLE